MRKTFLVAILSVAPFLLKAQETGILFDTYKTWREILLNAKLQHKYIFVDCYATWCGPCRQMDADVYPKSKVGDYINSNFISVKMQMDSSNTDNTVVRMRYPDAHQISVSYHVNAMPTFLFFNPEGKLISTEVGLQSPDHFIMMAKTAVDQDVRFTSLLQRYQEGKSNMHEIPELAILATKLGEKELAVKVANEYTSNYLFKLQRDELYENENIEFMKKFTSSSKDAGFIFFYDHSDQVNEVMHDSAYAQGVVDKIIIREDILPLVNKAVKNKKEPDWVNIQKRITAKYDQNYALRNIIKCKVTYYRNTQQWADYSKCLVQMVSKYGRPMKRDSTDTSFMISMYWNNYAWEIFNHSHDNKCLKVALTWSKWVVSEDEKRPGLFSSQDLDTYANLLYKLGKKKEAITWEEKVVQLQPTDKGSQQTLQKMKKGLPTWQ